MSQRNTLSSQVASVNSIIDRTLGDTYANVLQVLQAMPLIRSVLDQLPAVTTPVTTADTIFVSVKKYGAKGDGVTDDTVALQKAFTAAILNKIGLYFPDGKYLINGTIQLGIDLTSVITGLLFQGASRGGVIIEQVTDNVPMFRFVGQFIHTLKFRTMTLQFKNLQVGATEGNIFEADGEHTGSFYNSLFEDISANNFYWFFNSPTMLWWGNCYRDMWLGDFAGGVNNIAGQAGEPNCRFERMYISCQSATEILFHHEAMAAQYDNIEVNSANSGATMLYDASGGTHVIGHWALEGAHYATDATLFKVPNGVLLADFIYTETISTDEGVNVNIFHCEGDRSFVDVKFLSVKGLGEMLGTLTAVLAIGPKLARFKELLMPFAANVRLVDQLATVSSDFVTVENWNDPGRTTIIHDEDVVLSFDDCVNQIFTGDLTLLRTVKLPQGSPDNTTQLFTGRRFRITKAVIAGQAQIVDSFGNLIATLGVGRQVVEVVWHRSGGPGDDGFSWLVVDQRTY